MEDEKNVKTSIEQELKEKELELRILEIKSKENTLKNKLGVSIPQVTLIVGILTFLGSFLGTYLQGWNELKTKTLEFESSLIIKAVETGNKEQSVENLKFLMEAGFLTDDEGNINRMLSDSSNFNILLPARNGTFSNIIRSDINQFSKSKANDIVLSILETVGMEKMKIELYKSGEVSINDLNSKKLGYTGDAESKIEIENAAALILGNGRKIIVYSENFITDINSTIGTNWPAIIIFAHEIGHLVLDHHYNSEKDVGLKHELEADEWSGFVAQKLGASLNDTELIFSYFDNQEKSEDFPPYDKRINAIRVGWLKAKNN